MKKLIITIGAISVLLSAITGAFLIFKMHGKEEA